MDSWGVLVLAMTEDDRDVEYLGLSNDSHVVHKC